MSSLKLTKHYLKMNYYLISNWPDLSIYPSYYSLTFGSGYFPKYRLFKGRCRQPVFTLIKEEKIFHISSDYSIAWQINKKVYLIFFAGFTSWVTRRVKKQFRKQMFPFSTKAWRHSIEIPQNSQAVSITLAITLEKCELELHIYQFIRWLERKQTHNSYSLESKCNCH